MMQPMLSGGTVQSAHAGGVRVELLLRADALHRMVLQISVDISRHVYAFVDMCRCVDMCS